jgi:hypothetical protein
MQSAELPFQCNQGNGNQEAESNYPFFDSLNESAFVARGVDAVIQPHPQGTMTEKYREEKEQLYGGREGQLHILACIASPARIPILERGRSPDDNR